MVSYVKWIGDKSRELAYTRGMISYSSSDG